MASSLSFRLHNIAYMDNIVTITASNVNTDFISANIIETKKITTDITETSKITAISPAIGVQIEGITVKLDTVYAGGISLKCPDNSNTVTLKAPSSMISSYDFKFPIDMGVPGYVLATNGVDNVYWSVGGGGGGSTFLDNAFQIIDHTDTSKHIMFDVTAITANRTITMPDTDVVLPDQSVSKTSSPTFNTVITNSIKENTPGAGISLLKSDSKKIMSAKPDALYFYDDNEICYKSIHGMIGTVPTGSSAYTICNIAFTSASVAYLDIYSVIKDGTQVDILSTQDVINYTGTPPLTLINVMDISKQIGLSYSVSGSSVIIQCTQDPVITKTYNTNVTIRPTAGTYTVTFY